MIQLALTLLYPMVLMRSCLPAPPRSVTPPCTKRFAASGHRVAWQSYVRSPSPRCGSGSISENRFRPNTSSQSKPPPAYPATICARIFTRVKSLDQRARPTLPLQKVPHEAALHPIAANVPEWSNAQQPAGQRPVRPAGTLRICAVSARGQRDRDASNRALNLAKNTVSRSAVSDCNSRRSSTDAAAPK